MRARGWEQFWIVALATDPKPLGELVGKALDETIQRRAGLNTQLLANWQQIVGDVLAEHTCPDKIRWPRQERDADDFTPATLIIAAEGVWALRVQHQTSEIIDRINAYFGYGAIDRIQLRQRPVHKSEPGQSQAAAIELSAKQIRKIEDLTANIDDEQLRNSVQELGRKVLSENQKPDTETDD